MINTIDSDFKMTTEFSYDNMSNRVEDTGVYLHLNNTGLAIFYILLFDCPSASGISFKKYI